MRTFANWEEVPLFDSEEAEADFWAENRPDLRLMEAAIAGNAEASESVTITLRIDPRMLARIKRLARIAVFELPEHDQAMVERADGTGIERTIK